MLQGGCTVIGPMLVGLTKPVRIAGLSAKDSDIVNMAAIVAYTAGQCEGLCGMKLKAR